MAIRTPEELRTAINTRVGDNTSGQISAEDARILYTDIVDSGVPDIRQFMVEATTAAKTNSQEIYILKIDYIHVDTTLLHFLASISIEANTPTGNNSHTQTNYLIRRGDGIIDGSGFILQPGRQTLLHQDTWVLNTHTPTPASNRGSIYFRFITNSTVTNSNSATLGNASLTASRPFNLCVNLKKIAPTFIISAVTIYAEGQPRNATQNRGQWGTGLSEWLTVVGTSTLPSGQTRKKLDVVYPDVRELAVAGNGTRANLDRRT